MKSCSVWFLLIFSAHYITRLLEIELFLCPPPVTDQTSNILPPFKHTGSELNFTRQILGAVQLCFNDLFHLYILKITCFFE